MAKDDYYRRKIKVDEPAVDKVKEVETESKEIELTAKDLREQAEELIKKAEAKEKAEAEAAAKAEAEAAAKERLEKAHRRQRFFFVHDAEGGIDFGHPFDNPLDAKFLDPDYVVVMCIVENGKYVRPCEISDF